MRRAVLPIILAIFFSLLNIVPVYCLFVLVENLPLEIPLYQALLVFPCFALFLFVERYGMIRIFGGTAHLGNLLILGTGLTTERTIEEIESCDADIKLVGTLTKNAEEVGQFIGGCEIVGQIRDLRDHVAQLKVETILISPLDEEVYLPADFLFKCRDAGIEVLDTEKFHMSITGKPLEHATPA